MFFLYLWPFLTTLSMCLPLSLSSLTIRYAMSSYSSLKTRDKSNKLGGGCFFNSVILAYAFFNSAVNLANSWMDNSPNLLFTHSSIWYIHACRFLYDFKASATILSTNGLNFFAQILNCCSNFFWGFTIFSKLSWDNMYFKYLNGIEAVSDVFIISGIDLEPIEAPYWT